MIAAAVATVAAFNLSCAVQQSEKLGGDAPVARSFTRTIRIDLAAMRWCDAACFETQPIKAVSHTEIILEQSMIPEAQLYNYTKINRESGAFVHAHRVGSQVVASSATCPRKRFTGFPPRPF